MLNNVFWIIGEAGTGKTTKTINEYKNKAMFLSFTHAGVENLKLRGVKKAKTIHSYFHIGIDEQGNNKLIFGGVNLDDVIIFDEFGLIPYEIFNLIFYYARENKENKFIFVGDILQLSAITKDRNFKIDYLKEFKSLQSDILIKTVEHLFKSVWFMDEFRFGNKLLLTQQFRTKENLFKNLQVEEFNPSLFVSTSFNFLSCKKKILREIGLKTGIIKNSCVSNSCLSVLGWINENELCLSYGEDKGIKTAHEFLNSTNENLLNENEKIKKSTKNKEKITKDEKTPSMHTLKTENLLLNQSTNNDLCKDVNKEMSENLEVSLIPIRLLTVHKAQGMEFDNVCVVVDDFQEFDISMFYTSITRAKKTLKIVYLKTVFDIQENLRIFNEMKRFIYENLGVKMN